MSEVFKCKMKINNVKLRRVFFSLVANGLINPNIQKINDLIHHVFITDNQTYIHLQTATNE